jgi:hypothetical protein
MKKAVFSDRLFFAPVTLLNHTHMNNKVVAKLDRLEPSGLGIDECIVIS